MRLPPNRRLAKGFSLMELLVAMGISMVLLGALASIFATSIQTREKIDKEGQKIENARYSLDTLAEDVRLAGYYGILAPGLAGTTLVNGATAADYAYLDPCSTATGNLASWDSTGASNITVPMPIFGYEAHGTGTLPTALTDCLDNYKTNTDVLVLRRASTTAITAGSSDWVSGDPYLQIQSCPTNQPTQPPGFIARATSTSADFSRLALDCASTSSVRRLYYRIYFISQCDDCVNNLDNNSTTPGDGVPTLKMVELGMNGGSLKVKENVRTIAPNVVDMHIEYGIDTTDDGSIDSWTVSNNNPRQTGADGRTVVTGMRLDSNSENRWEDVMAIKLFLITRDAKPTTGYTDTKSFIAGTKTIAAANDAYRRRLMSTIVKLVNMAGRRETP